VAFVKSAFSHEVGFQLQSNLLKATGYNEIRLYRQILRHFIAPTIDLQVMLTIIASLRLPKAHVEAPVAGSMILAYNDNLVIETPFLTAYLNLLRAYNDELEHFLVE